MIDEAHHATAETYGRIIGHLGLDQADTKKLLVGFTAKPNGTAAEAVTGDTPAAASRALSRPEAA